MKKYIRLLPVMLFPYVFIFILYFIGITTAAVTMESVNIFGRIAAALLAVLLAAAPLVFSIWGAVYAAGSDISAYTAAKLNLIVKAVQIPAYVLNFLLGAAGTVMSVWGIGFIAYAVIADVLTIILTGIHAAGCVVKMRKEGAVKTSHAILAGIGSFIFCADVAAAIALFVSCRKAQRSL